MYQNQQEAQLLLW